MKKKEQSERKQNEAENDTVKGKGKQKGEEKGKAGAKGKTASGLEEDSIQGPFQRHFATISIGVGNTPEAARAMQEDDADADLSSAEWAKEDEERENTR